VTHLRRALFVLVVLSAIAVALSAQSQQPFDPDQVPVMPAGPTPQFRSRTVLVPIDVRVVGKNGQPVTDLTASDFSILEDGVPQKIWHHLALSYADERLAEIRRRA